MRRTVWSMALAGMLGASVVLAGTERPKPREDDLALVKRAVAQNQTVSAAGRPEVEVKAAPRATARSHDPQWFKIRVVDKATRKSKVTVNLPLAVVKALGDDMPIDWPCGGRDSRVRSTIKLSEVLSALEAGQDLVQVDDDDSEVRVWVE